MGGCSLRDESVSDFFQCVEEIDHGLGVQFAVLEEAVAETLVFVGGEVPELRCREGARGGVAAIAGAGSGLLYSGAGGVARGRVFSMAGSPWACSGVVSGSG